MKYARYNKDKQRREVWEELVDRNKQMHLERFPQIAEAIEDAYKLVYEKKVLPSMRSLQFAGKAIDVNPARIYNCSGMNMDDWRAFPEAMFLLLSGTGVGVSVQNRHVSKLPAIRKPDKNRTRRYVVGDSIAGWADAVKHLMKSYFGMNKSTPLFDFSDIREKGAELVTSGGKAPGPQPLKECLVKIEGILSQKDEGSQLRPIEVHDIICYIAEAVLSGGIRRSAVITLFSKGDNEMRAAKTGNWWELSPQRAMSNNSEVFLRSDTTEEEFYESWEYSKASGAGEPGFMWSDNLDMVANPCMEISLSDTGLCNLTEIKASDIEDETDFLRRCWAASLIGTLQASYTDFYYLRDNWRKTAEKEALLGVSMTGIASLEVFKYDRVRGADVVRQTNEIIAKLIGINPASRLTAVKPAGTTSLVLGTSSGIHAWHDKFFIRRIRVNKNEAIYTYLLINHPELLEDDWMNPKTTGVISVPVKAPEEAVTRDEKALDLLHRVIDITETWVHPGHVDGDNKNNVSCTVSVRDDEWDEVRDFMWDNRGKYTGISILPHSDHTYKQAPFESCSEEKYNELSKSLVSVDLSKVIELTNETNLQGEQACAGGSCEVS
jgi:ribonucleoside-diphosphate reductase alpha chain